MNWTNLEAAIPYDALLDLGIRWPCSRNAQAIHSPSSSKFHRSFFAKKNCVLVKDGENSHRFCPVLGWIFHLNHSYPRQRSQDPSDRSCNPHLCGWADGGTLDRNGPCPNGFAYFYGDQNPKTQHLMILMCDAYFSGGSYAVWESWWWFQSVVSHPFLWNLWGTREQPSTRFRISSMWQCI